MKIGEVVSLKLAGYSVDDIKEIGQFAEADPGVIEAAKQVKSMDELRGLIELSSIGQAPQQNKAADPGADPSPNQEEDPGTAGSLEAQLEAEKNRSRELTEKLAKAQAANARADLSGRAADAVAEAENLLIDMINNL